MLALDATDFVSIVGKSVARVESVASVPIDGAPSCQLTLFFDGGERLTFDLMMLAGVAYVVPPKKRKKK